MISHSMRDALNRQFNHELYSSYLYLAMAAWCDAKGFKGSASWMRVQSQEELAHAMILHNYLLEQDAEVAFPSIQAPDFQAQTVAQLFEAALAHERKVTASFHELAGLAQDERDFATGNFIRFFVDEQVEEEASFRAILDQLRLIGDVGHALFLIDRELSQRTFTMPPQLAA
jgi:ferritin